MIVIIDLGLGNVNSVSRVLTYLRIPNAISNDILEIEKANKLIFPGVGNFLEASKRLKIKGMDKKIKEAVIEEKKPLLGICLGMQLLAREGEEGGQNQGLGLIDTKVLRLRSGEKGLRLPHVGWNNVAHNNMRLFTGIGPKACFYFVHSFEMMPHDPSATYAECNYGIDFVAAVKKDNIVGVQFHPEKSQKAGLQILKNFAEGVY